MCALLAGASVILSVCLNVSLLHHFMSFLTIVGPIPVLCYCRVDNKDSAGLVRSTLPLDNVSRQRYAAEGAGRHKGISPGLEKTKAPVLFAFFFITSHSQRSLHGLIVLSYIICSCFHFFMAVYSELVVRDKCVIDDYLCCVPRYLFSPFN